MTDRTIKALEQAVAFARGDCKHDYIHISSSASGAKTWECSKCKVRVTSWPDTGLGTDDAGD